MDQQTFQQWVADGLITPRESISKIVSLDKKVGILEGTLNRGRILGVDLDGVTVASADGRSALIGMSFLRRFNFLIDGPNKKLHLQPRQKIAPPLAADFMLGARFQFKGEQCFVESLNPKGGPFNDAGVKAGDDISESGGTGC